LSPVTVLVADDAEEIRALLRVVLEFESRLELVGEAANGAEAVTLAEALQPDVVVLDVAMPVMDGVQAIPEIRRLSPATRIVVLTGFDEKVGKEAMAAGADAYVHKSSDLTKLAETLLEVAAGVRRK
jgi:DNA-binding NarL/FixJ family response regulator